MTDPRDFNEQASPEPDRGDQAEPIDELEARVDDDDQVTGGRAKQGDPCEGGEIAKRLR